ncbi:MAG: hypothetical protein NUV82_00855 [Candidatus Komeilibacteria bacterium]|nr:hypothetical protein [Candidatus Komeilibacteria bacterium]
MMNYRKALDEQLPDHGNDYGPDGSYASPAEMKDLAMTILGSIPASIPKKTLDIINNDKMGLSNKLCSLIIQTGHIDRIQSMIRTLKLAEIDCDLTHLLYPMNPPPLTQGDQNLQYHLCVVPAITPSATIRALEKLSNIKVEMPSDYVIESVRGNSNYLPYAIWLDKTVFLTDQEYPDDFSFKGWRHNYTTLWEELFYLLLNQGNWDQNVWQQNEENNPRICFGSWLADDKNTRATVLCEFKYGTNSKVVTVKPATPDSEGFYRKVHTNRFV